MNIGLTVDPEIPVPPVAYGGVERIVDLLARGYAARGHDVTVLAHPESKPAGHLVPWRGASSGSLADTVRNAATLFRQSRLRDFDVVQSFGRLAYLLPLLPASMPKLMCYQRHVTRKSIQTAARLARCLEFSACSSWMRRDVEDLGAWHTVPNAVETSRFPFTASVDADAPVVFLGRVEEIKGPHLAIAAARAAGVPLVIAGNIPPEHQAWFDQHVAPQLSEHVRYVGPVDDASKAELLGRARAFLMPILWDEPFGIVMIEALACGTPVVGLRRGAVPEVVEQGVTGYVCDDPSELPAAILRAEGIDRRRCRTSVERRFSSEVVVETYLGILERLQATCSGRLAS